MATFEDFMQLDIRVGEIVQVEAFPKARKPAFKIWVDFGKEIGIKKTSAQVTELYNRDKLIGRQVLGIVNLPAKQVADFMSEVRILGVYTSDGVVLVHPAANVKKGAVVG